MQMLEDAITPEGLRDFERRRELHKLDLLAAARKLPENCSLDPDAWHGPYVEHEDIAEICRQVARERMAGVK